MTIYQAYNKRINAWVKYEFGKSGFKPLDVKQRNPKVAFKGIKKRGNKIK